MTDVHRRGYFFWSGFVSTNTAIARVRIATYNPQQLGSGGGILRFAPFQRQGKQGREEAREAKEKATPTPTSKSKQEHRVHSRNAGGAKKDIVRTKREIGSELRTATTRGDDEDNPDYR
jgi:hypothetical protein